MQRDGVVEGPRRLATILAADISGYSRLLAADEEGTLARVKRHRRELVEPTVADHNGRIVKWMGDGFLAEFASPVEAVRCAVVIQQSMAGRNAALARPHWIQFRVGVNLGDIIIDSDDIYGEGVNLAVRLQDLADPGGVYISGGVYELVKNKLVVGYQPLGDHKVKNITEPVRVYRVLPDPQAVATARGLRAAGAAAIVVAGGIAVGLYWWQAGMARNETKSEPAAARAPSPAGTSVAPPGAAEQSPGAATRPVPTQSTDAGEEQHRVAAIAPPPPSPPVPSGVREPEMVALSGGSFMMGSNDDPTEKPIHRVTIRPFLLGKFPVTVGEWKQCVAAGACAAVAATDDAAPVTNVSWSDAQGFASWLKRATNKDYRLATEAEWEYAARGATQTRYWWGNDVALGMADCRGCGGAHDPHAPVKVGSFPPNPFGLHDMTGGVAQWVSDCWHKDYRGAPANGASWEGADCSAHVLRGGSWQNDPSYLRAASRDHYDTVVRYFTHGFRVARSP